MSKHPIQPLEMIDGVKRFKQNKILGYLFDQGCIDMNKLAMIDFPQDDRQQFAQLIGYSLDGYSELSYGEDEVIASAELMLNGMDEKDARISYLSEELDVLRETLREPIARLFHIHPDDLRGVP